RHTRWPRDWSSDVCSSDLLMIWDMAGEEDGAPVKLNQLRDAAGYLLVIDGTRAKTLEVARSIQQRVEAEIGVRPFLALVNKVDRSEERRVGEEVMRGGVRG